MPSLVQNHDVCDSMSWGHAIFGNFSTDKMVIELTKT